MGKVDAFSKEDKVALYHTIGMGALKYFLLKVDPKKRLLFDPNESVDFQGHTGPFIQYTHARIKSVLSRADYQVGIKPTVTELAGVERDLIVLLDKYPETVKEAAKGYSPAVIANYVYELAKTYNKFYHGAHCRAHCIPVAVGSSAYAVHFGCLLFVNCSDLSCLIIC